MQWHKDKFTITTDKSRFDLDVIHNFLTNCYWAKGIPRETVARSIEHSMGFAILDDNALVGFARVMTDRTTFAYIGDVFVLNEARGQGLGKWLMETILSHPELQGLRNWTLFTADAHGLYRQFGFEVYDQPHKFMMFSDFEGYSTQEERRMDNG